MPKKSNRWFEISEDGFRRMNAGRPLGELVREAVQNSMDSTATEIVVKVTAKTVEIEDNAAEGISDPDLIHTVFLTDKEDSHLKRGRKGRGLKELIIAGSEATVETSGTLVKFDAKGRSESKSSRTEGTVVRVSNKKGWGKREVQGAVNLLSRIVPDHGVQYSVNGQQIDRPGLKDTAVNCSLPTVVISSGVERNPVMSGEVELLNTDSESGWVYEMGIPIQCPAGDDLPYHLNVKMRVPLSDTRNTVDPNYLSKMYAAVVEYLVSNGHRLSKTEMKGGWFESAMVSIDGYSTVAREIATAVIGDQPKNCVLKETGEGSRRANDRAQQLGFELIDPKGMSGAMRNLLGCWVESARSKVEKVEASAPKVAVDNESKLHDKVKRFAKALCEATLGVEVMVELFSEGLNIQGSRTMATWTRSYSRAAVLRINTQGTKEMFGDLLGVEFLDLMAHEMAHQYADSHYNDNYINALSKVAAKMALALVSNPKVRKLGKKGGRTPQSAEKKARKAARRRELERGLPYSRDQYEAFKRSDLYVLGSILGVNTFKINKTEDIIEALLEAQPRHL